MLSTARLAIRTARARSKATRPTSAAGMCKREVRECYAIGSNGTADAAAAWAASPTKHRETDISKIPRGVPVYWTGGSHGHGHIAISTGWGKVWSTDIMRTGYFDKVPTDLIHARWPDLVLVGWSEHVEGVRVIEATR